MSRTFQLIGPRYERTPGNPLEWAPLAWWITAVVILYIVGVWIMYRHAKYYDRNTVRWTTAAIIFTPVLAWAAYGLSWRKSK
jgi:lipoprotein signal peptidase